MGSPNSINPKYNQNALVIKTVRSLIPYYCWSFCQLSTVNRPKPTFLSLFQHKLVSRFIITGDLSIQDGILDGILDDTYILGGRNTKGLHDQFSGYRRLPVAQVVFFFHFLAALPYQLKIGQEPPYL